MFFNRCLPPCPPRHPCKPCMPCVCRPPVKPPICCLPPVAPPIPPECPKPFVVGWMRSSETYGFVPGARLLAAPPIDGVFSGWNFPWARSHTPIQYFENLSMLEAAISGAYSRSVLSVDEPLFPDTGWAIGVDYVWDGGTSHQIFDGYFNDYVPGGWASWANVEIASNYLFSPETRVNVPGMYLPYHYSLRRFTSYVDLDLSCYALDSAFLVSAFTNGLTGEFFFPINDSLFVFVNGTLVYWASDDIIGGGNVSQQRSAFYGVNGIILNREFIAPDIPPDAQFLFTDGWYLTLGGENKIANIAPYLRNGKNVIDVIADDYYFGGGMSKFDILFYTTPLP